MKRIGGSRIAHTGSFCRRQLFDGRSRSTGDAGKGHWRRAQTAVGQENFTTISRVGEMEQAPKPIRRVRFGEFEVDFLDRCLYRQGLKIKINERPLQVLSVLVGRRGEIVRRGRNP
jgi:hypothetical protein